MSNMSIYLIHVNLEKRQNGIIQAIGKSAITKREMSRGIVLKKKKKSTHTEEKRGKYLYCGELRIPNHKPAQFVI